MKTKTLEKNTLFYVYAIEQSTIKNGGIYLNVGFKEETKFGDTNLFQFYSNNHINAK